MKKIFLLLTLLQALIAQNVPFVMDHPVYHFLERLESRGMINSEYWSTRPYTLMQINELLSEVEKHKGELSSRDVSLLRRFQLEFNRNFQDDGVTFPWSKSTLAKLRHPDEFDQLPFFMTYKHKSSKGWINWSETFRAQYNGDATRGYHTDFLGISGVKGNIAFTTQYTFHRITRTSGYTDLPDTYKEGYVLDRDYMKWINWGYPTSSLTYTHPDFSFGIHRQPIYWGYSANNSPILSDNVHPLPHIEWSTEMPHLRFKFIHARLSPNEDLKDDTLNTRRNLSAHRVEFDLTSNFEFAFNEFVVYAHRDFELGYLNPVNFLFAEEQTQGDLDNKLMAIDFKWRIKPGVTTYGTWFFDELDFWKLFSGWWGNKFVFQLGATYYPKQNLPSLNIEYTAARPWTYSHLHPVNSFASAGRILGLKSGPNTKSLRIAAEWQVTKDLFVSAQKSFIQRGDDPGSNVLASYSERGDFESEDDNFLLGEILSDAQTEFRLSYNYMENVFLFTHWKGSQYIDIGLDLDF
ncbi:MAG: hypothetical protein HQ556_10660 [Candidatus Marinimicrobia bacterium]|nr:hypothetical protein [Candidatus Neomarinimicrobiota bacterium]